MRPSKNIIDFIHSFEGYHKALPDGRCTAYPDVGNPSTGEPWTIGFGTTQYRGPGLKKYKRAKVLRGDVLTEAEAETEFLAHVNYVAQVVNRLNPNLNQHQFDAAVSFFHNNGFYNSAGEWSLQAQRLKDGDLARFEIMLPQYTKGGNGVTLAGLVRRRQGELAIWRKGGSKVSKVGWLALTRRNDKYILSAMDGDTALREHEFTSTAQLISLLRQYPDAGTTVVTKEDWTAPNEGIIEQPKDPVTTIHRMRLERTGKKESQGCEELRLSITGTGLSWLCRSGQPWAQVFEQGGMHNRPGSMMPLPAGEWEVGPVEFKRKDDYSASWGSGLGPVWIGLEPKFTTRRSAIGIHLDTGAYSTAGCVGVKTVEDLKSLVEAVQRYKPKSLTVVW